MNKIACLSAVAACVLAVTAGSAFAGQSTVSGGYAQSDYQGVANKSSGFNLKYRYEWSDSQLGYITSFTHTEKAASAIARLFTTKHNTTPSLLVQLTVSTIGLAFMAWSVWVMAVSARTTQHLLATKTAPAITASLMVRVCSLTQCKMLPWTFLTNRVAFVTLTLVLGLLALVTLSKQQLRMVSIHL